MKYKVLREFLNHCLHNPCTKASRYINGMLIFLIISSIAVIPLHFVPELAPNLKKILFLFDRFVVTIFSAEYLLRLWSARRPWSYVSSWWGLIDLLAVLPFYLARFGLIGSPEIFLTLRLLRMLKFGKVYGMEQYAIHCAQTEGHGSFQVLAGEEIERVVQKHPIIFLAEVALPVLLTSIGLMILVFLEGAFWGFIIAFVFFAFAGLFFVKAWLDYNYDVIYITNRRVIMQNRQIFGTTSNDVAYEAITNVIPDNRGFWQWLLGIGNITIETPSTDNLHFYHLAHPHKVMHKISENRQHIHVAKEKAKDHKKKPNRESQMYNNMEDRSRSDEKEE